MRDSWDRRDPLAALAAGDPEPYEEFVRTEVGTLLGFFHRLGADPQEAEDLVQELFLKLYRTAPRYAARERFTAYVFRVARNAWIDGTRRRAVRPPAAKGEDPNAKTHEPREPARASAAPPSLEDREDARRLHLALAELPESHRAVFELGALQELSYPEVGTLLDIPVGTVKSRMFYAVRRLREMLAGSPEEAER